MTGLRSTSPSCMSLPSGAREASGSRRSRSGAAAGPRSRRAVGVVGSRSPPPPGGPPEATRNHGVCGPLQDQESGRLAGSASEVGVCRFLWLDGSSSLGRCRAGEGAWCSADLTPPQRRRRSTRLDAAVARPPHPILEPFGVPGPPDAASLRTRGRQSRCRLERRDRFFLSLPFVLAAKRRTRGASPRRWRRYGRG